MTSYLSIERIVEYRSIHPLGPKRVRQTEVSGTRISNTIYREVFSNK